MARRRTRRLAPLPAPKEVTKGVLKTIHHVYHNSKPVPGAAPIIIDKPLTGHVDHPAVNKMLDVIRDEAKAIAEKIKPGAYPVLHSYKPVETDEKEPCYCNTCKTRFEANRVYGCLLPPPKCPNGHDNTTNKSWGKCSKCKKGMMWETSAVPAGPECIVHNMKCDTCGHTDSEPID
jgi:hypothetical protein